MRKLKLQMQISLDGFIADKNGKMDWMTWNWDDSLNTYVSSITENIDTIVLGRGLATDGFIDTWTSTATNEPENNFAKKMINSRKIVFSRTLKTHDWENTTISDEDLISAINKIKAENGDDIIAYGGGKFVSSLIQNNLIDEYYLFINPVMLGEGQPIMDKLTERLLLEHVESKGFPCGITLVSYKPTNQN